MESKQSLSLSQDQDPPHYLQAEQDIPPKRMGSKEPVQTVGISPSPTAANPTECPGLTTVIHIQGAKFSLRPVHSLSV